MAEITVNGVALASPVSISNSDEIIWSSGTGRSANGQMSGDVIANKKTIQISWGILTQDEYNAIRNIPSGFFNAVVQGQSIRAYRSTISGSCLGTFSDGVTYYNDVSTSFIEQ
ncbi:MULTISPECIES: hypothetical protein [unclassified Granulicatella]|uniref:hypothetical protein n=1 Tax=unclassified Granulicatella TaxID=2630493 RepID=UPI00066A7DC3|nr:MULTISPECIES: hypothetical protein [unclassified Granulicatella]